MYVVPCFGCRRPSGEAVYVHALEGAKRTTADALTQGGWLKRVRRHEFWLCTVCLELFDRDSVFVESVAQKASVKAGGVG